MSITRKDQLNEVFEKAISNDTEYIAVVIQFDGRLQPEVIINHKSNFHYKLNYYNSVYDLALDHKHANNLKIIDAFSGNSYAEIEYILTLKSLKDDN